MFKSIAAMLVASTAAAELSSGHYRAMNAIEDAMQYVQLGSKEHIYLQNALTSMSMKTDAEILESHS